MKKSFLGYDVKMTSQRYKVFRDSGLKCIKCGIEGKYFALEADAPNAKQNKYHFNLYAIDDRGNEVLMTKDHIIPRSRGGSNHISNLQTMCVRCNIRKGNNLE